MAGVSAGGCAKKILLRGVNIALPSRGTTLVSCEQQSGSIGLLPSLLARRCPRPVEDELLRGGVQPVSGRPPTLPPTVPWCPQLLAIRQGRLRECAIAPHFLASGVF